MTEESVMDAYYIWWIYRSAAAAERKNPKCIRSMANERQVPEEQAEQRILEEKLNRYPFRHYLSLGGGCSVHLRPNYYESDSEEENGIKGQMLAGKRSTRLNGDDRKEFNGHGAKKRRKRVSESLAIDDEDKKGAHSTMQNNVNCAGADDNDVNTLSISTCYTLKLKKQIIKRFETKSHKINNEYNIARIEIGNHGLDKHSKIQQILNLMGASPPWDNKNVFVDRRDRFPYKQDESKEITAPVFGKNLFSLPCAEDRLNMLQTSAQVHVHSNRSDSLSKCQERFPSHLYLEGAKVPSKVGKRRRYTYDISTLPTKIQDAGTGQEILDESPIDVGKNGNGRKKICKRRFSEDISILPSKIEGTGIGQVTQANGQARFRDNLEEPPKLTIREDEFENTSGRDGKNKIGRKKGCKGRRITEEISILPPTIEAKDTSQVTRTNKKHVTFRDDLEEPPKLTIREDEFENTSWRDGKNENDRKKVCIRRFFEDISIFPSKIRDEDTNSIIPTDKKHVTFKDDLEGSAKVSNKEDELDKTSGRDEKDGNDRKKVSTRRLTEDVSIFPSKIQVEDRNPVNQPIKKHVTFKDKVEPPESSNRRLLEDISILPSKIQVGGTTQVAQTNTKHGTFKDKAEEPPEGPNRRDERSENGNKDCNRRFLEDIYIFPSKIQVEDTSQVAQTNTKHGTFKDKSEEPPEGPNEMRRDEKSEDGNKDCNRRFSEDISIFPSKIQVEGTSQVALTNTKHGTFKDKAEEPPRGPNGKQGLKRVFKGRFTEDLSILPSIEVVQEIDGKDKLKGSTNVKKNNKLADKIRQIEEKDTSNKECKPRSTQETLKVSSNVQILEKGDQITNSEDKNQEKIQESLKSSSIKNKVGKGSRKSQKKNNTSKLNKKTKNRVPPKELKSNNTKSPKVGSKLKDQILENWKDLFQPEILLTKDAGMVKIRPELNQQDANKLHPKNTQNIHNPQDWKKISESLKNLKKVQKRTTTGFQRQTTADDQNWQNSNSTDKKKGKTCIRGKSKALKARKSVESTKEKEKPISEENTRDSPGKLKSSEEKKPSNNDKHSSYIPDELESKLKLIFGVSDIESLLEDTPTDKSKDGSKQSKTNESRKTGPRDNISLASKKRIEQELGKMKQNAESVDNASVASKKNACVDCLSLSALITDQEVEAFIKKRNDLNNLKNILMKSFSSEESLFSQRKESPSKKKDGDSSDISGLIEERPSSELETGNKTNENCIEQPSDEPTVEAGPSTLTQTSKENASSADFGDHTYSQCTTATEETVNSDSSCHDAELFKDTHNAPENRPDLANTECGVEAVSVTVVTLDPAEICHTNSLEITNEETVESMRRNSPTEAQDDHLKVDDNFITDVGQNLSKSPLHSSASSKFTELSTIIVISSDESDSDLDQVMEVDTDDFTDRLDARNRSYFHQSPDGKQDNWSFGNAAFREDSTQNGVEDISKLECTIAQAGGFVGDVFHRQSLEESGLQGVTKGFALSVHSTPLHLNEKEATEDCIESSYDADDPTMTGMEHYKKRLIHQHEKPGVTPAPEEEEDSSESPASPRDSSQRQRVARKRLNCRGQFRHQSMELFKLGNSLPTSLCKTKEPYNICTEKNLQMCNERGGTKNNVRQPPSNVYLPPSNDFLTKSIPKDDSKFKDKPPIWRSNSLNNEIHEPQKMPSNSDNVENRNIGRHVLPPVVMLPDFRKNGTKSLPDSIGTIKNNAEKDSNEIDIHNLNSSNNVQETNRSRTGIDTDVLSTQSQNIAESGASTSSEFDTSDCGPINLSTKNRQTGEPQQSNSYNVPYTNRNGAHHLNNTIPKQPSNVPRRPSQVQENDVAENDIVGTIVNEQLEAGSVNRDGCSVVTIPPNTLDPQRSNVILISFPNVQKQMSRMVTEVQQSPPETFDSAIMSLVNIARSMVELEFNVVSLPVLNRLYMDLSNYSSLQAVPALMKSCIQETLESLVAYLIENMLHVPWSVRLKNFVHKMLQLDLRPHLAFLTTSLALIRQKVGNDTFLGDLLAILRHAPHESVQITGPPRSSTRQTDEEVDAQRSAVLPNPPFRQYFPTGNPWAADFWNRFWTTDRHSDPSPRNSFPANFPDNVPGPHVNILRSPTQRAVPETSVSRDVPSLRNSNHPGRSRAPSNGSRGFPPNDPQTSALYTNGLDNVLDGYDYRPTNADANPNTRCNLTLERQELYLADNRCIPPKKLPIPATIFPANMSKQPKTPRGRPRSSTGQSTTPVKRSRNSTPSTDEERAVTREKRAVYRENRDKDDVSNNFVAHRPTNGETSANGSLYGYRGAAPVSAFNDSVRAGSNLQRLPNSTPHDCSQANNTSTSGFQETDGGILPQIRSEAENGSVPEGNVRPQTMIAGKAVILSNEIVRQKERAGELTISNVSAENVGRSTATEKDVESLLQANIIVNNLQNRAEKTSPKKSFHANKTPKAETRKHTQPFTVSGFRNSRIQAQKKNPDELGHVNGSFERNVADKRSSCEGKAVPSTVIIEDGSMEVSKVNGSGRLDKGNATDLNDVTVERVTVNSDNSILYSTYRNDRSKAVESTCRITRVADAETTRAWQKLQLDVSIEKIPHFGSHKNALELAALKRKSVEREEQRKKMKTGPPLTEKRDGGAKNELGTKKFDHNQNNLHKSRNRQRGETGNPIGVMRNSLSAGSSGKEGAENADTAVSVENPIIEDISSDEEVSEPFRLHSMYEPEVAGDPKEILQTTEVSHCKLIEGSVKAVQDANRHLFEKPPVYTRPVTPHDVRRPFKNSSKREPLAKLVRFEEDADSFTCSLDLSGSAVLSPVPAFQTNVSPVRSPNFKSPTRPGLLVQPVAQTLPPKSPILPGSPVVQMSPQLQLVSPVCAATPPSEGSRMNGGVWFGGERDNGFFDFDRSLSIENDSSPSDDALYEIKVGSKLYRVERSLYEKIPKGKLCYIRESYSFVRYFDDNQMELFINNLNLGDGSTIAKDLLKQVRGREVDPTDTEICLGQETGKNEVIHLSKGVVFSTLDYLAEAELYVEEMEKVQRYVPRDFYGFYKFVTGYQIVNQHHPISFQTFLTMHNTNGIRRLFKNYVNSLLEGRDLL